MISQDASVQHFALASTTIAFAYFERAKMVWTLQLNLLDYLLTQGKHLFSNWI